MPDSDVSSALTDERLEILRLVENQTVTAEEANRLLEALDRSDSTQRTSQVTAPFSFAPAPPPPPEPLAPRMGSVRIRITDLDSGKARINLVLPHRLVDSGIKLAKRLAPEHMLDGREIRKSIEDGYWGPLLDITDEKQRVEIIVEGDPAAFTQPRRPRPEPFSPIDDLD
jgi:hypothetical protein